MLRRLIAVMLLSTSLFFASAQGIEDENAYCNADLLGSFQQLVSQAGLEMQAKVEAGDIEGDNSAFDALNYFMDALNRAKIACTGRIAFSEGYDIQKGSMMVLEEDQYLVEMITTHTASIRLEPESDGGCETVETVVDETESQDRGWALIKTKGHCLYKVFVETDAPEWEVYLHRLSPNLPDFDFFGD